MSEEPDYAAAFDELQIIVSEIESGEISVDELSEKVKRATALIRICKLKLRRRLSAQPPLSGYASSS
jgi:exodeoxyribonuclease VII small subunit